MGGDHHWAKASRSLRARLAREIPHDVLKELHRKSPARHLAIAARQFLILAAASRSCPGGSPSPGSGSRRRWSRAGPRSTSPSCSTRSCIGRSGTVPAREAERVLALLYAIPSGISALQFTRWHLTHHAELGDPVEADPKRHYLSPKTNKPWFKLLYFTPALFPIYFRAARRETASYPPTLQRRIARERWATILLHVAIMAGLFDRGRSRSARPRLPRSLLPGLSDRLRFEPPRPALRDRPRATPPSGARSWSPLGSGSSGISTPRTTSSTTTSPPFRSTTCAGFTSRCGPSSTRSAGSRSPTGSFCGPGSGTTRLRIQTGIWPAERFGEDGSFVARADASASAAHFVIFRNGRDPGSQSPDSGAQRRPPPGVRRRTRSRA